MGSMYVVGKWSKSVGKRNILKLNNCKCKRSARDGNSGLRVRGGFSNLNLATESSCTYRRKKGIT